MKVTRDWLFENTKYGAPTRAQFVALGVPYPPPKGWLDRLIGLDITERMANEYIAAQNIRAKKNNFSPKLNTDRQYDSQENWKFCPHCGKSLER